MPEINILICIWRRNFLPQCHSNFRMSLPLILVWHISSEWCAYLSAEPLLAAMITGAERNKRRSSFVHNISAGMCDSLFLFDLSFLRPASKFTQTHEKSFYSVASDHFVWRICFYASCFRTLANGEWLCFASPYAINNPSQQMVANKCWKYVHALKWQQWRRWQLHSPAHAIAAVACVADGGTNEDKRFSSFFFLLYLNFHSWIVCVCLAWQ